MDDYALVLNAGSSSLKFCVFSRPVAEKWRLEARGQIEGIGTSPATSAKGSDGRVISDSRLKCGRSVTAMPPSTHWPPGSVRSTGVPAF